MQKPSTLILPSRMWLTHQEYRGFTWLFLTSHPTKQQASPFSSKLGWPIGCWCQSGGVYESPLSSSLLLDITKYQEYDEYRKLTPVHKHHIVWHLVIRNASRIILVPILPIPKSFCEGGVRFLNNCPLSTPWKLAGTLSLIPKVERLLLLLQAYCFIIIC